MNAISSTILFFLILIFTYKNFYHLKKIDNKTFFLILFNISLIGIITTEFDLLYTFWNIERSTFLFKLSLGLFTGMSVVLTACTIIKDFSLKKIKTLWRLPLIGLLIGWSVKIDYLFLVPVIGEGISLIILNKFRQEYQYSFRQQLKSFFFILILVFAGLSKLWIFNIGFILFLSLKLQFINALKLKFAVSDYKTI